MGLNPIRWVKTQFGKASDSEGTSCVESHGGKLLGQLQVRLLAVCLVAFAGFVLCDELVNAQVTCHAEGMVVQIQSSKIDQYRIVIACTGQVTCPVGMMERYFRMGEVGHSSQAKLFRGIVQNKGRECLCKNGGLRSRELLWVLTQHCLKCIACGLRLPQ